MTNARWIGWGLAVVVAGCTTSGSTGSPGDGSVQGPVGCGDGVCALGENQASCAGDCQPALAYDGSIDGCLGGLEQPDIDSSLAVVGTTADSYHEMVACGGLAVSLSTSLISVVASGLTDPEGGVPDDFQYVGDGQYQTGSGGTAMDLEFLLGSTFELGAEDEVVRFDLFDWDNYLVGPSVAVDPFNLSVEISYDRAGPLVELLGFGPDPGNPLVVGVDELASFGGPVTHLKMRATVDVTDPQADATVTYRSISVPKRLNAVLVEGFDYDLIAASTIGPGGTLGTTAWGVAYNQVAGALDGAVDIEVRGGAVDLDGTLTYDQDTYPTITLSCAGG